MGSPQDFGRRELASPFISPAVSYAPMGYTLVFVRTREPDLLLPAESARRGLSDSFCNRSSLGVVSERRALTVTETETPIRHDRSNSVGSLNVNDALRHTFTVASLGSFSRRSFGTRFAIGDISGTYRTGHQHQAFCVTSYGTSHVAAEVVWFMPRYAHAAMLHCKTETIRRQHR